MDCTTHDFETWYDHLNDWVKVRYGMTATMTESEARMYYDDEWSVEDVAYEMAVVAGIINE